jgi:hypothetical protein
MAREGGIEVEGRLSRCYQTRLPADEVMLEVSPYDLSKRGGLFTARSDKHAEIGSAFFIKIDNHLL